MKKSFFFIIFLFTAIQNIAYPAKGEALLKNLIDIKGVRENSLIGYSLVIGLNGTGDDGNQVTDDAFKKMLKKLNLKPDKELSSKNIASVIVTAKLPPFARLGQKIDVSVSSIGNAESLAGGTLLLTPLKSTDGNVYAIASGHISIGGLKAGKKFPTSGRVANGAIIEREQKLNFNNKKNLRLSLRNPDFTTAYRIQKTLNKTLGGLYAISQDSATIDLNIPTNYKKNVVELISLIERIKVQPDIRSKIIINERTGTIVAGDDFVLKGFTLSHNDLTIEVANEGEEENLGPQKLFHVEQKTTINDLIKALNKIGVTPEDLISIFQSLKKNGLISSELEFI